MTLPRPARNGLRSPIESVHYLRDVTVDAALRPAVTRFVALLLALALQAGRETA